MIWTEKVPMIGPGPQKTTIECEIQVYQVDISRFLGSETHFLAVSWYVGDTFPALVDYWHGEQYIVDILPKITEKRGFWPKNGDFRPKMG